MTVAEVAAAMGVSSNTVRRLIGIGEIPAARVGRSLRLPRKTVEEYLRGLYAPGTEPTR